MRSKEKRRNALYALSSFFYSSPPGSHFLTISSPNAQCYFFDSDVGGFHYGPGHPYVPILGDNDITLNHVLFFTAVQHEAHSDSYVPFLGNELWTLQENGNICK